MLIFIRNGSGINIKAINATIAKTKIIEQLKQTNDKKYWNNYS